MLQISKQTRLASGWYSQLPWLCFDLFVEILLYRHLATASGNDLLEKFYSDLSLSQQCHGIKEQRLLPQDADNSMMTPMDTESSSTDGMEGKQASSAVCIDEDEEEHPSKKPAIVIDDDPVRDDVFPTVDLESLLRPLDPAQEKEVKTALRSKVSRTPVDPIGRQL